MFEVENRNMLLSACYEFVLDITTILNCTIPKIVLSESLLSGDPLHTFLRKLVAILLSLLEIERPTY